MKKNRTCIPCDVNKQETAEKRCAPVSFCAGNYTMNWDGKCMTATRRKDPIPDGTYTAFTMQDGCIIDASIAPLAIYTPPDCCEPAGGGGGTGDLPPISTFPGNLITELPDGLMAQLFTDVPSCGVTVSGDGTATSPLRIGMTISSNANSLLNCGPSGLETILYIKDTDTVTHMGTGTLADPLQFTSIAEVTTLPDTGVVPPDSGEDCGIVIGTDGRIYDLPGAPQWPPVLEGRSESPTFLTVTKDACQMRIAFNSATVQSMIDSSLDSYSLNPLPSLIQNWFDSNKQRYSLPQLLLTIDITQTSATPPVNVSTTYKGYLTGLPNINYIVECGGNTSFVTTDTNGLAIIGTHILPADTGTGDISMIESLAINNTAVVRLGSGFIVGSAIIAKNTTTTTTP